MSDLISRQAAIEKIEEYADRLQMVNWKENPGIAYKAYTLNWCINTIRDLPSAQSDNKINLCDSCRYSYPVCPSKAEDVIWGNGTGHDNICACSKYEPSAQPEKGKCKKCRYVYYDKEFGNYWCNRKPDSFMVEEDGYCKWGK